tara:strand:- start:784 stop:1278 length:495 start_codon:yes stop_codon:yes gene_type:complete
MSVKDRLLVALDAAEAKAEEERQRILNLMDGKSEADSRQIWEEERSVMLRYLEEEVEVAETNLILREARQYHLPGPDRSDQHSWYESQLSFSRYLSPDAKRNLRRALLEEGRTSREEDRRDAGGRRARMNAWVAILSVAVAAIALLRDVSFGTFIVDLVKAIKD